MSSRQAANDNVVATEPGRTATLDRKCPICGRPTLPEVRPFCSKRCADVDLHRWLGGVYAIPAAETDDAERQD